MIVRILGEGQFLVPESERASLESLDQVVADAVDHGDEAAFGPALAKLVAAVRQAGTALADAAPAPSDLVLPFSDASLAEMKRLLDDVEESAGEGIG
ncbi:MAG: PspA-associated protein PspAA [Acidimicrobiales bacterium]